MPNVMGFLLALLLLTPQPGAAESALCPDAETTLEMSQCMRAEVDAARARLKLHLADVRAGLSGESKNDALAVAALDESQRLWEEFVRSDCKAEDAQYAGGSIRGLAAVSLELSHVELRTRSLWDRYLRTRANALPEPTARP